MANAKQPPRPPFTKQNQPNPNQPQRTYQEAPPAWVLEQMKRGNQGRPIPPNPRNYLRPNMKKAKVFDLNKMMSTWGANQAKYKEGDEFISKKILQNLDKTDGFAGIVSQDKFKKNIKVIDDIISGIKGEISYKFKGADGYLAEEVLDQNYIHHYADLVWKYYQEKNKNETEKEEK